MDQTKNVFSGPEAIAKFFDPDANPMIPLVELPPDMNPYAKRGIRIFAKLMYFVPLLNIKSVMAWSMLLDAQAKHQLGEDVTIVENSSGNTAISFGIMGKSLGVKKVVAFVPKDIAPGKLELLRLAGVEVKMVNPGEKGGIEQAREATRYDGFFNPGQYHNETNIQAHYKWTGRQIWEQTEGKISLFCTGLGTTGTALGVKSFLRQQGSNAAVIGVIVEDGNAIPGVRTRKRLEEISFDWEPGLDFTVEMNAKESYRQSLALFRHGLMAGPSSGFALAGLLKFLESQPDLERFRNVDGEVLAVFVCPDSPYLYSEKYSTILDSEDF